MCKNYSVGNPSHGSHFRESMRFASSLVIAVLCLSACYGQAPDVGNGAAALQQQNRRLDAAYQHLRARLRAHPQEQAAVRNEQRDWLQHRDFACSGSDGTDHIPCLIRETRTKADQVEARLH